MKKRKKKHAKSMHSVNINQSIQCNCSSEDCKKSHQSQLSNNTLEKKNDFFLSQQIRNKHKGLSHKKTSRPKNFKKIDPPPSMSRTLYLPPFCPCGHTIANDPSIPPDQTFSL